MNSDTKTIIYSAYLLSPEEIQAIIKKFDFINIDHLKNIVDEEILAGIKIHHGVKIIDLSLGYKLTNLKKKMYENSR